MRSMTIVIYHNPACATSRKTLAMIRRTGAEPEIIEYLKTPPSRARLVGLIADMGIAARDLLRRKGALYAQLGIDDRSLTDEQLIDLMITSPVLIDRPIVVTARGVRLCRPSERVLEILPSPNIDDFVNDGGKIVRRSKMPR